MCSRVLQSENSDVPVKLRTHLSVLNIINAASIADSASIDNKNSH